MIDSNFWNNKTVLVTGHTGFKGSWLCLWLQQLGSTVVGLSLEPTTQPNLYDVAHVGDNMTSVIGDIRDLTVVHQVFQQYQPEIVIHMAAQALVRCSYLDPVETYQTNVMGTMNILEGIRSCNTVKAAVMVTTDKCYDNKEWSWPYREHDRLGGHDPYSSSKACCELLIDSYRKSFFDDQSVAIASARAGNVIGGGDWSTDRLIPDIVRAKTARTPLKIRSPEAIRPWQHVLDPLRGYLVLAEKLVKHGSNYAAAWNFGPTNDGVKTVKWIADYIADKWPDFNWEIEQTSQLHEANILKLDCTKAYDELGWRPNLTFENALELSIDWYEQFAAGSDMAGICEQQLKQFISQY